MCPFAFQWSYQKLAVTLTRLFDKTICMVSEKLILLLKKVKIHQFQDFLICACKSFGQFAFEEYGDKYHFLPDFVEVKNIIKLNKMISFAHFFQNGFWALQFFKIHSTFLSIPDTNIYHINLSMCELSHLHKNGKSNFDGT